MSGKHIVSSFDRDLESIQAKVMRMGGLAEVAMRDAVQALELGDIEMAETVRRNDAAIDALNEEIRASAAQLLALRAPTAIDLRVILSVMTISASLERIGDYAKNIAKRVSAISGQQQINGSYSTLKRMTQFVIAMLSDALDSYIHHNVELARDVSERDREADQMYNTLFRSLLTHMMEDHRNIAAGMHLHFMAKNIERCGDHATTIAEQTIYMVTGEKPADDRPKADVTATTMEGNA